MRKKIYRVSKALQILVLVFIVAALASIAGCAGKKAVPKAEPAKPKYVPWTINAPRAEKPLPPLPLDESAQAQALRDQLTNLILEAQLGDPNIGVVVEALTDQRALFALNEHLPLTPASNTKLYTTAAALEGLSAEFRYQTRLAVRGERNGPLVNGDLVVLGSGDPTISGGLGEEGIMGDMKQWIGEIKAKGIAMVSGHLVGDESLFDQYTLCPGCTWDDESKTFAAHSGALSCNQNCISVVLEPGERDGDQAEVCLLPDTGYVAVANESQTSGKKKPKPYLTVERVHESNVIEVKGQFPRRAQKKVVGVTVEDPAGYFVTVLAEAMEAAGITIQGGRKVFSGQPELYRSQDLETLFTHSSPPLGVILAETNKESNNFYAEQLLKTLGAGVHGKGTRETGVDVITQWLLSMGVPDSEIDLYDGSGLSRYNRVSPRATATLLRYMAAQPDFETYFRSLAIAGVDGTLKRRMRGTPAEGNVHAKSGFLKRISALSGYVVGADAKLYSFVVMVDDTSSTGKAKELQDAICILLSRYSSN